MLCLLHAVRADHERAALALQVPQVVPRASRAVGVQRRRWLIGEHQSRTVQGGPDQRDLLPHTFGEGAKPAVARIRELEGLEQLADPSPAQPWLDVVDGPEVVEVGAGRHALVQPGDLRHKTDAGANRRRVFGGVDAVDCHSSGSGQKHAAQAAQR